MKLTIKIDGMSCMHCVASVTNALQDLDGVSLVDVSLEQKNAVVEFDDTKLSADDLINTVEDIGFDASL